MKGFLFVLIFGLVTTTLWGRSHDVRSDRSRWLQKELELSKNQKKQIRSILNENRENIKKLKIEVEVAKKDLRAEFRTGEKSTAHNKKLKEKFEKLRTLKTDYQRAKFLMALEIRDVLNQEQLKKLHSLKDFNK